MDNFKQPFTLEDIEAAVRPQFTWDREYPRTRWKNSNKQIHAENEWLGAACFIGIAQMMGHQMKDIKIYMDLEPAEIDSKFRMFKERMREFTRRLLELKEEAPRKKSDAAAILHRRTSMAINALRLTEQIRNRTIHKK